MTLRDFENRYWHLEPLKNFAERIGIPAAKKLGKDELEEALVGVKPQTDCESRGPRSPDQGSDPPTAAAGRHCVWRPQ